MRLRCAHYPKVRERCMHRPYAPAVRNCALPVDRGSGMSTEAQCAWVAACVYQAWARVQVRA